MGRAAAIAVVTALLSCRAATPPAKPTPPLARAAYAHYLDGKLAVYREDWPAAIAALQLASKAAPDEPMIVADRAIRERYTGTSTIRVRVAAPEGDTLLDPRAMRGIAALQALLAKEPEISATLSVADSVQLMHRAMDEGAADPWAIPDDGALIAQYLLLPSLNALSAQHPQLRVELEVSDRLADMAREGIDIAIRTSTDLPETQVARALGQLGRALYASPAYAARAGLPQHPDELHQHRLISNTAAPNLNRWPFVVDGTPCRRTIDGHWRTNDTGLAANMVVQGLGIGRLATLAAAPLVQQGLLVPVLADFVDPQPVPLYAVTASARQRLPKIRACIDFWAGWIASDRTPNLAASAG